MKLDAAEEIKRFAEFFEQEYIKELVEIAAKGKHSVGVDFAKLSRFDPAIAEHLLNEPDEAIRAAELGVEQLDILSETKNLRVRFFNLPGTQYLMLRDIRSEHIGRVIVTEGLVRQKSDVRPQVVSSRFECPSCGNIISVLQLDTSFKEPSSCGCGRKGKFRLVSKQLVDAQGIVLEEAPEDLEGGEQPKRMNIFLKEDLVSPISDRKTNPGTRISVVGVVKEVPVILRSGSKSTRFELLIEANSIASVVEDFYDIPITREEEEVIKGIAADPDVYTKLTSSIAPSIYGYREVKEALVLQLAGGVQKRYKDGIVSRGDIHILLVGDPGAGKSQILKRIGVISPKGRYVSGKGASGAGLTAAVVKDEFLGGWSLEAGALVLANNGICCIDELDKMSKDDRSAMHEALEQQTVSISKANIQATLLARTTVLAAANPKFGRFDPYGIIAEQIDLPPALINRFDLVFPIKDIPDAERDDRIASHILHLHKSPDFEDVEIDSGLLRKYLAYARQNISPVLTENAVKEIKKYYVEMRNTNTGEDQATRAIPISARQLEALVRLSEASARARLSPRVTKRDARRAIDLLNYCLMQVGIDRETGKIDIDRLSTGIPSTKRAKIFTLKDIIAEMEVNTKSKMIPIEELMREASEKGLDEGEVEDLIEKLKRTGDIFEPRRGFVQRM
ncbi:AAA family ATPase [Candidatus Woesearchaeota archaeon CG08_land_8_20_14_0_20_47_9]|nr:MAG: hypothetical protein AUJ69_04235 [Candidatus Woesearchaeota archaeon CG1_02_47_18]PIN71964.1 MAG: AAA family ATPase [Candidatus Woesearchaeota archaeon CG10_big_fil_rev_8_21_14_0_10_47_5]PIO04079.1 MAG: AAA family ATPase [Candidatus Woesearchaeota archaeon CG08_land_8_20_14_0_20_47_9]HII30279.1 minichromosome maintenance protein MCM [Candidatus Woesearchaeota archaeon]